MYEQLSFINVSCPQMPSHYQGKTLSSGGVTKTAPREWTDAEIDWCMDLKRQGWSDRDIAESVGRDLTSVSIKMKRLKKSGDTYNADHIKEKYLLNDSFCEAVKPTTVLDAFSGVKHYWKTKLASGCVSNDHNTEIDADYHMEALKLLCKEYLEGNKYDLIDLDPYGSAFDCFDLALKMAKKALIVTYGELGHKRWKRLDYVRNTYQIDKLDYFNIETLIAKTQEIGRHNHKNLVVWNVGEWRNIARVYYIIEPLKITEQWEAKDG